MINIGSKMKNDVNNVSTYVEDIQTTRQGHKWYLLVTDEGVNFGASVDSDKVIYSIAEGQDIPVTEIKAPVDVEKVRYWWVDELALNKYWKQVDVVEVEKNSKITMTSAIETMDLINAVLKTVEDKIKNLREAGYDAEVRFDSDGTFMFVAKEDRIYTISHE